MAQQPFAAGSPPTPGNPSTQYVSDSAALNELITTVVNKFEASSDSLTIVVLGSLPLTGNIAPINTPGSVIIQATSGSSVSIDGASKYQGFVIMSGTVTISNLNINNMVSQGLQGCLGAGAGVFVGNLSQKEYKTSAAANVTLFNVSFSNCSAQGGSGTTISKGGAGGVYQAGTFEGGFGGAGAEGYKPSGDGLFQSSVTAGYFGIAGPPGSGGHYGGYDFDSTGGQGKAGGDGGYGGSAGCGGSGGGGAGAIITGGTGGTAGAAGSPGFGGGTGSWAAGQPPAENNGVGGLGGDSGNSGGAGLGGAIFVMDNAALLIQGDGSMSGGKAVGGEDVLIPNALSGALLPAGAGAGAFLQGAGLLTFAPANNYTVNDMIADETGAVRIGAAGICPSRTGPDGQEAGGGTGKWELAMTGSGTLALNGSHAFSGPITVSSGSLDLSAYENGGCCDLVLSKSPSLIVRPQTAAGTLQLGNFSVSTGASLLLNGNSRIVAETLEATFIELVLDPTGFTANEPVPLIQTTQPLPASLGIKLSPGYTSQAGANTVYVTLNQ